MSPLLRIVASLCLLIAAGTTLADSPSPPTDTAAGAGVPISRLIAIVAKKTGKKFVVDPNVRADIVLIGQDSSNLSYSDLLTILKVYGFAGVESGGYVQILPDALARQVPMPTVTPKDTRPDAEIVQAVIFVKSISASYLVPMLRPMIPQYGHLAAFPCRNALIIVDSFANVRRIEAIIRALDTGEPYSPPSCNPEKTSSNTN
jgi:general secretion pathway protein D